MCAVQTHNKKYYSHTKVKNDLLKNLLRIETGHCVQLGLGGISNNWTEVLIKRLKQLLPATTKDQHLLSRLTM